MDFTFDARTLDLRDQVLEFMDERVYPAEAVFAEQAETAPEWERLPVTEELKAEARARGLWNLFLTGKAAQAEVAKGLVPDPPLTNLQYAPLAEVMGWSPAVAPEAFNCAAPDTGNMELLAEFGSPRQQEKWLKPLLEGEIRSAFIMTEPAVASSDATNIATRIERRGDHYVITGRKWWSSGVGAPRCKIMIVMGKTDPESDKYRQQSQVLVPMDAPGVTVERMLPVFGFDDAPHGHGEVLFENVKVPLENMILGEGR